MNSVEIEKYILGFIIVDPTRFCPLIIRKYTPALFTDIRYHIAKNINEIIHMGRVPKDLLEIKSHMKSDTELINEIDALFDEKCDEAALIEDERFLELFQQLYDSMIRRAYSAKVSDKVNKFHDLTLETKDIIGEIADMSIKAAVSLRESKGVETHVGKIIMSDIVTPINEGRVVDSLILQPFGVEALDTLSDLLGHSPQSVIVVGGGTSSGKSVIGAHCLRGKAFMGIPSIVFSYETRKDKYSLRVLSMDSGIPTRRIKQHISKTGILSPGELARLNDTAVELQKWPIHFEEGIRLDRKSLVRAMREYFYRGFRFFVIDYLQLIPSPEGITESDYERVTKTSVEIQQFVYETNTTVVELAQLGRSNNVMKEKPTLQHLRNSGQIEQDADMIFLIDNEWRRREYMNDIEKSKVRNGQICIELAKRRDDGEPGGTVRRFMHPDLNYQIEPFNIIQGGLL